VSVWRIDDTDPACPVHILLAGPCAFPLRLTITEAMSLLRTAPKMATAWEYRDESPVWRRRDMHGNEVAAVFAFAGVWWRRVDDMNGSESESVEAARDAADAALRAAGWLLEE